MRFGFISAAFACVVMAGLATPALAKTIGVSPGPGTPIQDAVDGAATGDKIVLKKGVYGDSVTVVTDGLSFVGKRGAIWDAYNSTLSSHLDALTIQSNGVSVQGITFRNGNQHILSTGDGTVIKRCTSISSRSDAFDITGNGAVVDKCTIKFAGGSAIDIVGDDFLIRGVKVLNPDSDAIEVNGADGKIEKVCVRNSAEDGISVGANCDNLQILRCKLIAGDGEGVGGGSCDDVTISRCTIKSFDCGGVDVSTVSRWTVERCTIEGITDDDGIYLNGGSGCKVINNRVKNIYSEGIDMSSQNDCVVTGNRVAGCADTAICVSGNDFEITKNVVMESSEEEKGIDASGNTGLVENNKVMDQASNAFELNMSDGVIRNNTAMRCGLTSDEAFEIFGDDNEISNCKAVDCSGDGFNVNGDGNTLTNCRVQNGGRDGFDVEGGDGNALVRCQATGCAAEGLDNGGTNTDVSTSTFRGNRIDVTNDGSFGTFAGSNRFDTGSETTPSEIN